MQWVIGIYSLALVVNHDDNWLQLKIAITQPGELQQKLFRYIPPNSGPQKYSNTGATDQSLSKVRSRIILAKTN
jgi:hypothetical protein